LTNIKKSFALIAIKNQSSTECKYQINSIIQQVKIIIRDHVAYYNPHHCLFAYEYMNQCALLIL